MSNSMKSSCGEASWRPFRAPLSLGPAFQGLRSFHSLTPGYSPCTPPACETAVSKRLRSLHSLTPVHFREDEIVNGVKPSRFRSGKWYVCRDKQRHKHSKETSSCPHTLSLISTFRTP